MNPRIAIQGKHLKSRIISERRHPRPLSELISLELRVLEVAIKVLDRLRWGIEATLNLYLRYAQELDRSFAENPNPQRLSPEQ
jgi:hypothetical protein